MKNKSSQEKLTHLEWKFVQIYNGNGALAARAAGYKGDEKSIGVTAAQVLGRTRVLDAIRAREAEKLKRPIMTRRERQALWSEMAMDVTRPDEIRLKAAELLGRSQADFVDRHRLEDPNGNPIGAPAPIDWTKIDNTALMQIIKLGASIESHPETAVMGN